MTLDINYSTTSPRQVDKVLESAIEELQAGGATQSNIHGISITGLGAKCDAIRTFGGGAITSGTNAFTGSGVTFTSEDVGKLFYIAGAGPSGSLYSSTISGFISATQVTLSDNALTTVTNAHFIYGTDDSAAWLTAYNSALDGANCTFYIPFGMSLTSNIQLKSNMSVVGSQPDGWAFKNYKRTTGILLKPGSNSAGLFTSVNGSVGNIQLEKLCVDGAFRFHKNAVTRYSGATTVAGSNIVNFTNGTFTNLDVGKKIVVFGAGVSGALQEAGYTGVITGVNSSNQIVVEDAQNPAALSKTNVAYCYGFSDHQGLDGVTTQNSTTFSAASANFTSADVGKIVVLYGAVLPQWGDGTLNNGDGKGDDLVTHITAVTNSTTVVLNDQCELSLTNVRWRVGSQDGIYQQKAPISQDSMWHMSRCVFQYFPGNGYSISYYQRAQRIYASYFWQCAGHGMYVRSTDNTFIACMWAECGEDGVYVSYGSNHFLGGDTFNNEGNGIYLGGYAGQTQINSLMIDNNGKNGMVDFGVGIVKLGCRFTSNSQKLHNTYADYTCAKKHNTGPTNINKPGNQLVGCYWELGGNGNLPTHGIFSIGPFGVRGTGVNYDPAKTLWVQGVITSSTVTSLHQHSTSFEAGTTLTFMGNNTLSFPGSGGTKIGLDGTQKLGFYGADPIIKPNVSGAKGGNTALASLITALVSLGIVSDTTT